MNKIMITKKRRMMITAMIVAKIVRHFISLWITLSLKKRPKNKDMKGFPQKIDLSRNENRKSYFRRA